MNRTLDMSVSPYDRGAPSQSPPALTQLAYRPRERWVPSRFNARTVGDDGRLILWNTLTGTMSVFEAADRERVLRKLAHEGLPSPLDRTAEHLAKRGFLVRAGVDQVDVYRYQYAKQQWRTDMLHLILLASEDCNFRCVYCYEKFERGTMTPQVRQGVRALVERHAPTLKALNVGWFGGEPLYGWDAIEELEPFFNDVAARNGIALRHHMTTNGYLLTEERATRLLDWGCRQFQITLDGLPSEHDCKRVGRDGSATYGVILDNLRSLRGRRGAEFEVGIRVNFDRDNFPRLGPFMEALSEEFGGDERFRVHFRAIGRWGGANDAELSTCGTGEERAFLRDLQATAASLGLRQEGGIREISAPGSQACYAARPYSFIVGASGQLMKCTVALYDMPENVVGQLHPDGTLELADDHMRHWVNPHWESDSLCKTCYALPSCQGAACPLTRVRDGHRTCCGIKSHLKHEMRSTLAETRPAAVRIPALAIAPAGVPAGSGEAQLAGV